MRVVGLGRRVLTPDRRAAAPGDRVAAPDRCALCSRLAHPRSLAETADLLAPAATRAAEPMRPPTEPRGSVAGRTASAMQMGTNAVDTALPVPFKAAGPDEHASPRTQLLLAAEQHTLCAAQPARSAPQQVRSRAETARPATELAMRETEKVVREKEMVVRKTQRTMRARLLIVRWRERTVRKTERIMQAKQIVVSRGQQRLPTGESVFDDGEFVRRHVDFIVRTRERVAHSELLI